MKTNEMHNYKIRVRDLRDALPAEVVEAPIQWNRDEIFELAWVLPLHCDLSEFTSPGHDRGFGRVCSRIKPELLWDALVRASVSYHQNGTNEPKCKVKLRGRKFGAGMHHRTQRSRVCVRADGFAVYIQIGGGNELYMDNSTGERIIETLNSAYDHAVNLMDDEIREELHLTLAPCTNQEFVDAYCVAHAKKFGEEFSTI